MNRQKAAIGAVAGVALGALTLRAVRKRRAADGADDPATPREEARAAAEDAMAEANEAIAHAAAAVSRADDATRNLAEHVREGGEPAETDEGGSTGRVPRVGTGWVRR